MHRLKAFILVLSSQRLLDPYVDKSLAVQSRKLKKATASLKGDPCLTLQTSQVAVSWTCKTFGTSNLSQLKVLKNFYGINLLKCYLVQRGLKQLHFVKLTVLTS